jgi:hypothetical protein
VSIEAGGIEDNSCKKETARVSEREREREGEETATLKQKKVQRLTRCDHH